MTNNTIPNVPRELLEVIEQTWRIHYQGGPVTTDIAADAIEKGLGQLRALLSAPSPAGVDADHVEDVRAMVKAQGVVMPERKTKADYGVYIDEFADEAAAIYNAALDEVTRLNAAPVQRVSVPASAFASRAITHYEAALLAAFPSGSSGEVFNQWNEARRVLAASPAAPAADAGLVDMYRHLQTVTPYRFKKIQDASVTDGGDVLYFHKDRFDAALLDDMAANCAKESK